MNLSCAANRTSPNGAKLVLSYLMLRAHRHACARTFMIFSRTHENWVQHPMGMRTRNLASPRTRMPVCTKHNIDSARSIHQQES